MTTRRDVIRAGAGIAAILAAGKAPAGIVKSMLAARGAFLAARRGPALPYDSEVEWLQGDGASGLWIPCDVNNGKFEVSYYRTSLQTQYLVQSARRSSEASNVDVSIAHQRNSNTLSRGSTVCLHMANQNINEAYGAWFSSNTAQLTTKMSATLDIPNTRSMFWNGGGGTWSPTTFNSLPFVGLLCRAKSNNVTTNYSTAKICSFKTWESGTLTHDLRPVRKNGVGLFWDAATGVLWPVSGTGAFTIGPDKTA